MKKHPCEVIYELSDRPVYGQEKGICKILGKESLGVPFEKWVGENFTDWDKLKPGTIISNAALFCFDDTNDCLRRKLGRTERTRFRNYSHFVVNGEWKVFTKSQKKEIFEILVKETPMIAVVSDSGQKHLLFRYRYGFWQFELEFIRPNPEKLKWLVEKMKGIVALGFSKTDIEYGRYSGEKRLTKDETEMFQTNETLIKPYRGSKLFQIALWFVYI
ncbi:MAG: hypothetical protein N2517_09365 [Ignavibacteria bacterium]|nr:hypothetical protein [Ignavibacteria bacterium]